MKKYFISLGLIAAAAFTLTNCTQEIENPNQEPETVGFPFEIVASPAVTKTVNNGMSTVWAAGDAINLFHAAAGTTTYVSDGEFKFEGDNTFHGTLVAELEEDYCYDWYALYPYSSYVKTPASTSSGYMTVASSASGSQTQKGNDSMAHIAGANYPLAGVCKECEYIAGEPVQIEMSHLTSLLEVVVTNTTEDPLTVASVSLIAPENLVGTYYLDFTGDEVVYTSSGDNYVSKTANLAVQNATALANGESAKYYLAIKPFTAASGKTLTLSVNGYAKVITLSKDVTFTAGKIKTLNFAYDQEKVEVAEGEEVTIDFSAKGYANGDAVEVCQQAPISIAFDKGTNSNAPKYYTTGTALRVYAGNTITISTSIGKIIGVEFVFSSTETADNSNAISSNVGSFASPLWGGSSEEVVFTISGSTGHRRIQKFVITYDLEGAEVEATKLQAPVVTCSTANTTALTFTWAAVANASGYQVVFNGKTETTTALNYTVSDLEPETEYEISVMAIGDGSFYVDSDIATCKAKTSAVPVGETTESKDLSFADTSTRTSYSTNQQVWEQNGIKFINDKASSSTNVAEYAKPVRLYAGSKVTVEKVGMKKIVFDCNSSSYATALKNSIGTVSGVTVTVSSDKVTVEFSSSVDSFVIAKLSAQVRLDSLTVTYIN